MKNIKSKSGSALIMALWVILVLTAIVFSFAYEAKVQSNVNVFMRERSRLERLVENGTVIAEVVVAGAASVQSESEDESESDLEELLEDDRWIREKRQLKKEGSVIIGPIAVDAENPDDGIVTVEIKVKGSGAVSASNSSGSTSTGQAGASTGGSSKFNLNLLYPGEDGDPHYDAIWKAILSWANVPEDDMDIFTESWIDWRDKDDVARSSEYGAEAEYYEEEIEYERGENPIKPTNGPIPDIRELAYLRGFRDHPAILGVPNKDGLLVYDPEEKNTKEPYCVSNILDVLTIDYGSSTKIDIRHASKAVLMCIPGIQNTDEVDYDYQETSDIADAIIGYRKALEGEENDYTRYLKDSFDEPDWSWEKLNEITSDQIGAEAKEYITWDSAFGEGSIYELTITGQSRGQSHTIKAVAIANGEMLKYIGWQENP